MRLGNVSVKSGVRSAICLLLLLAAMASSAVVQDPSFEAANGTQSTYWTSFGNVFNEPNFPRSGARSLKMFGRFTGGSNNSGAYQNVSVRPGERVTASVWAYNRSSDPVAGNNYAVLKVVYRNAANADVAFMESKQITAATARNQWQLISASLGDAPIGTTHCAVYLLFFQPASTPFASGAVIFDDLALTVNSRREYRQVWSDEFDGTALNTRNWEPMIGDGTAYGIPGWGNNELQYYTDRSVNLNVSRGLLRIVARRENFGGKPYTSARLRTKGKFDPLYGRIEARIKVPAGQGLWSAFWMLPSTTQYGGWASSGEIDIMELLNSTDRLYNTIHYGNGWPNNVSSGSNVYRASTWADGFHTYAVEWEPDYLRWYVDGVLIYSRTSLNWFSAAAMWNQRAPFDQPFHLLLNLAVGGNWPGSPNLGTPFPSEMQVDWVRCYQRRMVTQPPPVTDRTP